MTESDFYRLVQSIVAEDLDSEIDAFDVEGRELVALARKGARAPERVNDDAHNRAGAGVFVALNYVALIWGTWKMIHEIKDWAAKRLARSSGDARDRWKQLLVEEGVTADVAETIVNKHISRLPPVTDPTKVNAD